MGQIRLARMAMKEGEMVRHETVINKPNLMEYEIHFNPAGEAIHRGCRHGPGLIVRNTRKKPFATRRHLKSSWLMHLGYEPYGKFFCLDCNDILGRQAVTLLQAKVGLADEPFVHEKADLGAEPPKVVEIRLWRYTVYTEEEVAEAAPQPCLNEPQDEMPF